MKRRYQARHRAVPRTAQPAVLPVEPPDVRLWVPPADPWAPHPLLPRQRPPLPAWAAATKPLPFLHRIGVR